MTTAPSSRVFKAHLVVWAVMGLASCTSYKVAPNDGGTGGSIRGAGGTSGGGTGGAGANGSGGGPGGAAAGGSGLGGAAGGYGGSGGAGITDGGADRAGTRTLGETCAGDQDCASNHCAGTICCDQSCTGPCAQCSSNGNCQMPADDPACGTVACPADTLCRDWATSITSNRCKAIGQCKAAADCPFVNAPAKTYCGLFQGMASVGQVCDGMGTCGRPTVTCGLDGECATSDHVCCASGLAGSACRTGSTCSPTDVGATCDEAADCPPGYVCCSWTNPGGSGISCMTSTACVQGQLAGFTAIVVCNPATAGECALGTTCQTTGAVPPFSVCKP